jgi:hypothetical protein
MANKIRILLAVMLLSLLSNGMTPRLVESSILSVVQQGYVRAIGGELTYINMNVSVPSNTDYQITRVDRPVIKVDSVNSIVNIVSSNPDNPFNYKVTSSVSLKARHYTYLPVSYQLGYNEMLYTKPTARIQSDDATIRDAARSITANSSDDFERISKLALWVNKQIEYDLSLTGKLKDAEWILKNRRGVCSEYSTLFVALARSIGIPARIVDGIAYDDEKNEWVGHAWAEAYVGEWVPVDPTWNPPEVGYLDAMHLEISKLFDNESFDDLFAYGSQNARLEWSQPDPHNTASVTILSFKEGEKNANYDLKGAAGTIGFGIRTLVFAVISSDDYRLLDLNLNRCNLINVEDGERYVILRPHETKVVSWLLTPTSGLSSNYEYTCPLAIGSNYLTEKNFTIKITPDADTINFNGFVEKTEVQLGENQTVYVDVGAARTYAGNLYLISDDSVYSQPIRKSGRYSFSIQPKRIGLNNVYLATSFGGAKELEFEVTQAGGIGVDVAAPQFVLLGSENEVQVNLTSNQSNNVRVTVSAGGYKEAKQVSLTGNKTLNFSINFTDSELQNITVTLESGEYLRELVEPITVYTLPLINLTKRLSDIGNGSVRSDLSFSGIENARDIALSVDGKQAQLMGGNASVVLAPGVHTLRLDYSDIGGRRHVYAEDIEVTALQNIGMNESSFESYVSGVFAILPLVLYFGSILILAVAVLVLKKIEGKPQ